MEGHDLDDQRRVFPDGTAIRGRRHARGWSPRDLVDAVAEAHWRATGTRQTITPDLLRGMEERNESVPYATLRMVASGLDCNPVELLLEDS